MDDGIGDPCMLCPCTGLMADDTGMCACDHNTAAHSSAPAVLFAERTCPSGSTKFSAPGGARGAENLRAAGLTVCTCCGKKYVLHQASPASQQPQQAQRPSNARAPASTLSNEERSRANTNQTSAAERHRQPPNVTGVAQNPLPSSLFNSRRNTFNFPRVGEPASTPPVTNTNAGPSPNSNNFLVFIHGEPRGTYTVPHFSPAGSENNTIEEEPHISSLRFPSQASPDFSRFCENAENLKLMFIFHPQGTAKTVITEVLKREYLAHLSNHGFTVAPDTPSSQDPQARFQPADNGFDFDLLKRLYSPRSKEIEKDTLPTMNEYDPQTLVNLTLGQFLKIVAKLPSVNLNGVTYQVAVIRTKKLLMGPMRDSGPFQGDGPPGAKHLCLTRKLWVGQFPGRNPGADIDLEQYCKTMCNWTVKPILPNNSSPPVGTRSEGLMSNTGENEDWPDYRSQDYTSGDDEIEIEDLRLFPPLDRAPSPSIAWELPELNPSDVSATLKKALADINIPHDRHDHKTFRFTAPDIATGAKVLHQCLWSVFTGTPLPQFERGISVSNATARAFNSRTIFANLGGGGSLAVGTGPLIAIWALFMRNLTSDTSIFVGTIKDDHFTLISHPADAVIWEMDTLPVSPMVLTSMLGSQTLCQTPAFIKAVAPETWDAYCSWPPSKLPNSNELKLKPGDAAATLLYACDISQTPLTVIRKWSQSQCKKLLGYPIFLALLFKACNQDAASIDTSRYFFHKNSKIRAALRAGFSMASTPGQIDLLQIISPSGHLSASDLVRTLYAGRVIESSGQVLKYIEYNNASIVPNSVGYVTTVKYKTCIERFKTLFEAYIKEPGHVTTCDENSSVDIAAALEVRSDLESVNAKVLHPLLVVQTMTSSMYLPVFDPNNDTQPLRIKFVPKFPTTERGLQTEGSPFFFRTCFKEWLVLLNEQTAKELYQTDKNAMTPAGIKSFHETLHATLLQAGFNYL
ncbi:hypothetical protein DFP72DRAFT_845755 [Ephemerocybe angulata]|uniref:Uncharacterized protein n=1 Tax=Ephemerocybe angulata TaxID=980116 RepID=A0A8H6I4P3_9AGAR|nr:hypothetical protein DFP72DRAFT_845755 [Tulosesus angulatus]